MLPACFMWLWNNLSVSPVKLLFEALGYIRTRVGSYVLWPCPPDTLLYLLFPNLQLTAVEGSINTSVQAFEFTPLIFMCQLLILGKTSFCYSQPHREKWVSNLGTNLSRLQCFGIPTAFAQIHSFSETTVSHTDDNSCSVQSVFREACFGEQISPPVSGCFCWAFQLSYNAISTEHNDQYNQLNTATFVRQEHRDLPL